MNAYKFRMSDWSLNVCSSYLAAAGPGQHLEQLAHTRIACLVLRVAITGNGLLARAQVSHHHACRGLEVTVVPGCLFLALEVEAARGFGDRKSVVSGKSGSVRVDLGGRRIIKKKNNHNKEQTHHTDK